MQDEQDEVGLPRQVIEILKLLAQNNPPEELAKAMGIGQNRVDELLAEIRRTYMTNDLMLAVAKAQKDGMIRKYRK